MRTRSAQKSHVVLALWVVAAYLLLLYAALRWGGGGSPARFPGSD